MPLDVNRRLGMEGEHIGPGVGELSQVMLRLLNHQVHIQRPVGEASNGADQRGAEGKVGDEMTIHDIDVEPVRPTGNRALNLLAKPAQVSAQDTRRNSDAHGGVPGPRLTTTVTGAPRGRPTPAAGRVASTTPASGPAAEVSTLPTLHAGGSHDFLGLIQVEPDDIGHRYQCRAGADDQLYHAVRL